MDIHLKNHVLILDEAHNIEDFSRESASCTITKDELQEAIAHLETRDDKREACEKLVSHGRLVDCPPFSFLLSLSD